MRFVPLRQPTHSASTTVGRRGLRGALLAILLFTAGGLPAETTKEYDVKAAFLYNFATFTEWPAEALGKPGTPFVIGVLGDDPFGPVLDELVRGEQVKGHPFTVLRSRHLEDFRHCQILFVSASEEKRMDEVLLRLQGRPILTVADIPGFAEAGGAIGFITATSVGLRINPVAVQSAKLSISSKLMRLAQLVDSGSSVR